MKKVKDRYMAVSSNYKESYDGNLEFVINSVFRPTLVDGVLHVHVRYYKPELLHSYSAEWSDDERRCDILKVLMFRLSSGRHYPLWSIFKEVQS